MTTVITPSALAVGSDSATPSHFQDEARESLLRVRQAVGGFVEALGQPVRRAADLQRVLGVDKVLAWQVFRVWSAPDPLHAARYVPTPIPLSRVLKAGGERGVPKPVVQVLAEACEGFESLVDRHAGDRSSFDSMIAGLGSTGGPGAGPSTIRDRRAAFRANSRLWGVRAQAQVACAIYHPVEGRADSVLITGYVGVQQLRPGARLRVCAKSGTRNDTATARGDGSSTEHVAGARVNRPCPGDVELIEDFCTRPLPSFVTREAEGGMFETHMEFRGVGRSSAVTYFVQRLIPNWPPAGESRFGVGGTARVPAEVLLVDMLVPVGWSNPAIADAAVYGNLFETERGLDYRPEDRLTTETNEHLGHSLERLRTPDCPRYQEMVEGVLAKQGWSGTRFDIYRCRVEYPILHACLTAGAAALPRG